MWNKIFLMSFYRALRMSTFLFLNALKKGNFMLDKNNKITRHVQVFFFISFKKYICISRRFARFLITKKSSSWKAVKGRFYISVHDYEGCLRFLKTSNALRWTFVAPLERINKLPFVHHSIKIWILIIFVEIPI